MAMVSLSACIANKSMAAVEMTEYQCHKRVHALPLKLGTYNRARGWTIPDDEDPERDGYLVVYNCGTPNEYVSWSPADVFEDGYTPLD